LQPFATLIVADKFHCFILLRSLYIKAIIMENDQSNREQRFRRMIASLVRKIIQEIREDPIESDDYPAKYEKKDKNRERAIRRPFTPQKNKRFM
jgi:hypothetical protein